MGSWSESRGITKECFAVVKENPYLLLFPVIAGVVGTVVVLAVAGVGVGVLGPAVSTADVANGGDIPTSVAVSAVVFAFIAAYLATAVTQICMAGVVHCANEELQGRDSSFGAGMSAAFGRLPQLLGWALIQTVVGWLLQAIQGNGSDNFVITILRAILATLAAVAWSVISFFVLPMIMLRGKGPISGMKESIGLIRSTWGKQIAGGVRIGGLIILISVLPGIIALVGGGFLAFTDKPGIGIPLMVLGGLVILVGQVLISTLRAVFSVALLHYAEDGTVIGPFSDTEMQHAVRVKA